MTTGWPEFTFPPINLWNLPKQYRDFVVNYERDTTLDTAVRTLLVSQLPNKDWCRNLAENARRKRE